MIDSNVNGLWKAVKGSCVIDVIGLLGSPEKLTGEHESMILITGLDKNEIQRT